MDVSWISMRYPAEWIGGVRIGKIFALIYFMFRDLCEGSLFFGTKVNILLNE